jgi:hypothetical protein
LSACGSSAESNPLTPLVDVWAWCAVRAPEAQSREPIPAGARQCTDLPELEVPSTGEDPRVRSFERLPGKRPFGRLLRKRPFERLRGVAARRWPAGQSPHVFIEGSKTSTRPLSARYSRTSSRPRAPLRFLQVDVSTSTTGTARTSRTTEGGRDDCHVGREEQPFRVASPSPATAEGTQGQGSRTPSLDTPHRDCSRRRLRPNPDRFGHLLSRVPLSSRSGVTWGESDAANATPLARQT